MLLRMFIILNFLVSLNCFSSTSGNDIIIDKKDMCVVCHGEFENRAITRLSCRHLFHTICLEEWNIHGRNSCPTCNADLKNDHAENFSKIVADRTGTNLRLENIRLENSNMILRNQFKYKQRNQTCILLISLSVGLVMVVSIILGAFSQCSII